MVCAILNDETNLVYHNALEQKLSLSNRQDRREKDIATCSNFMWDRIAQNKEMNHLQENWFWIFSVWGNNSTF